MSKTTPPPTIKNLNLRLSKVEQILPTLATKEDLRLATRDLALARDLATLGQKVAGLDQKVAGLDQRVTGLDQKVAGLDQRVAALDEKVAALDGKVGALDGKVGALDGKVGALDGKVEALQVQIREEAIETRRHFDVVAEAMRLDNRLVAEGHGNLRDRADAFEAKTELSIATLDRRVLRLEAKAPQPRQHRR